MKKLLLSLVVLALAACATTLTFDDQLSAGYGVVQTIATATDALLGAGTITSTQASAIDTQDANLKSALDAANTVYQTNQTTGGNQLATALSALAALNATVVALEVPATGVK